jgi:hypothetical protein
MPTPLPTAETVDLRPPDAAEAQRTAVGVASAVAPDGNLTDLQRVLIEALFPAMTTHAVEVEHYEPVSAEAFAASMAARDEQFRTRGVQIMLLCALILRPLPQDVVDRIAEFSRELSVDDRMIEVARRFAEGSFGLAAIDFERNGYTSTWRADDAEALHTSRSLAAAWDTAVDDPDLAARWEALNDLPDGTLGKGVWQLYRARGFEFPGRPGSAPPLLAQHDWVHVLADYGTTVENELEVFALIARANDDMRGFSLLAMVVSLFETGYLRTGAGLFEYDVGHVSTGETMAVRISDAMRRGALAHDVETGRWSIDFLMGVDWFELAPMPLPDVRARFSLPPKADGAVAAGSVGPWEPGGISPFQWRSGRAAAERDGRAYESYGASVAA